MDASCSAPCSSAPRYNVSEISGLSSQNYRLYKFSPDSPAPAGYVPAMPVLFPSFRSPGSSRLIWTVWTFADPEYAAHKTAHIFFRLKYDGGKALRCTSSDALYHPHISYFLLKLPVKKLCRKFARCRALAGTDLYSHIPHLPFISNQRTQCGSHLDQSEFLKGCNDLFHILICLRRLRKQQIRVMAYHLAFELCTAYGVPVVFAVNQKRPP